jgi:hypothetical protein
MEAAAEARTERSSRRFRRALACAGAVVAFGALAFGAWNSRRATTVEAGDVTLLYVGAEDCAPCRSWQNEERTKFVASSYFSRITYREVKAPHLQDVLKDEYWPEDLRTYRNLLQRSDGVPLWLIVSNHKLIERRFGVAEWRDNILPRIKSIAR